MQHSQHLQRRRSLGISFVETMVTAGLIATTATVAVPSFQDLLQRKQVDGRASEVAADLHLARSEAIMRNVPVRFSVPVGGPSTCYVVHTGGAGDCTCADAGPAQCADGATAIKTVTFPAQETVTLQATSRSMLFHPARGTATPTGTVKVLGPQHRAIHLVVNVMGRIRACAPDADMPGYKAC